MPNRVALLDSHTINQIAAGEVIERPASVVKELIENSIDAGSSRIEVTILGAGRELIRVADDGWGMSREDAILSLQRHATSKIRQAGDLHTVTSLGFRGEAIPSIASVSDFTIKTASGSDGRTVIQVAFGDQKSLETEAGPKGTEISVENLFGNTPARLKFLKTDTTETTAVIETVGRYAIAHPHVSFVLKIGEHESIRTTGKGDLLEALSHIWGADLARSLAEVDTTISNIRVQGFVGPPYINKPNRNHQIAFVNGRPVRSRTLFAALDAAYRSLTPDRRYCVASLSLSIDPSDVDINISPTKTEVKFHKEGAAFDAVRLAIKSALMEHGLMPAALPSLSAAPSSMAEAMVMASMPSYTPLESPTHLFTDPNQPRPGPRFPFAELLQDLKVLGQVANTFMVASTRRGIVVIDQHVAHERVLYEYLCGLKGSSAIESQSLLTPTPIEFDRAQAAALSDQLEELKSVGFILEPFGGTDFLIRAVPAVAADRDYRKLLRDVADELTQSNGKLKPQDAREKIWITSACRMAVKAGDVLSIPEMEKLIYDLAETENPYLCPHGRPITVTLTLDELMRRFKRT